MSKKIEKKFKKVLDIFKNGCYTNGALFGELSEWFKELVLKTSDSERNRGFESHTLRLEYLVHSCSFHMIYVFSNLEKYPSG